MMELKYLFWVACALFALAAISWAAEKIRNGGFSGRADFKRKELLTANEAEFLARLERAVPELRFHAQVSIGALLEPACTEAGNRKKYWRLRGMFSQKIVDFVAQCRQTGNVVALIELDDRTHVAQNDRKRDAMTASAGFRTIRWVSKAKPDSTEIRATLLPPPLGQSNEKALNQSEGKKVS